MKEREQEEKAKGKEENGEEKWKERKEGGEKGEEESEGKEESKREEERKGRRRQEKKEDGGIETEKRARGRETGGVKSKLLTSNANCPSIPRSCPLALSPGHSQILSRIRGDKIWEWPEDEATHPSHL